MNFFEAQDRSYRNTRRLIAVMTIAVIAVILSVSVAIAFTLWLSTTPTSHSSFSNWARTSTDLLAWIVAGTAAFIGFASLYRIASLRQGGSKVARELGGTLIAPGDNDPLRRRLHNVVTEMSLASGVPAPEVFVLDHESGINAFAAGFSGDDAAIAVTRGALETLSRDELQGVIAHEFSHIFNGDMRLNIQIMGPMFGMLAIGLLGRILLRGTRSSGRGRGKGGGAAALVALGVGFIVTGYVGLLLSRLIKAGISRQREYLADASAVQFTRQSAGIAGALKKIAGYVDQSEIQDNDAEEISHMLFASGFDQFSTLLSTHPPLLKRIQALEPGFSTEQLDELDTTTTQLDELSAAASGHASLAGADSAGSPGPQTGAADDPLIMATAASLVASIGNPDDRHYAAAKNFAAEIPPAIREALSSEYEAMLLVPALLLHADGPSRSRQLEYLERQLGAERSGHILRLHSALQDLRSETRLPLLQLALPVIKEQPRSRLEFLGTQLEHLALQDNELDFFEYALLRIYQHYMLRALQPMARRKWRNLQYPPMQAAAATLLHLFAEHGSAGSSSARNALEVELSRLRLEMNAPTEAEQDAPDAWIAAADGALAELQNCMPRDRQNIVEALIAIALHDGQISQQESELLRAFCNLLDTPLPPVLRGHD